MGNKVIKLSDGKKYIIANEIEINEKLYYQLLMVDGNTDFFVAERVGNDIILIKDKLMEAKILIEMSKNLPIKK